MRKVQEREREMGYEIVVFGAIFVITARQISAERNQAQILDCLLTPGDSRIASPTGSDKTEMWTAVFEDLQKKQN